MGKDELTLCNLHSKKRCGLIVAVAGIPKTIDNDIPIYHLIGTYLSLFLVGLSLAFLVGKNVVMWP